MNTMPTPAHFVAAHTAGYTGFRDMIVEAAKWHLETHRQVHSTKELSEALWPTRFAQGHDIEIRKRFVDALLKSAERELKAYASRGAVTGRTFGHAKRPWLWQAPAVMQQPERCSRREATPAEIANVMICPGAEYLSNAQKLGIAQVVLDNFWVETEA